MRKATLLTIFALGLFAGCGDDDKSDSSSSATTPAPAATATTTTDDSGGEAGERIDIEMENIAFNPKTVTAKVGQEVYWKNKDSVDHNVVATQGEDFKSENFGKDGTFEYKLDKAGDIKYTCTLHPGMDGEIKVTQ